VFLKFKAWAAIQYIRSIPRAIGVNDKKYEMIRLVKGKYNGKRCFIICTGPSLTYEDLELLKNEYTFGMNSLCLGYDKTSFRPDFFCFQDLKVYEKIKSHIKENTGMIIAPAGIEIEKGLEDRWSSFFCCGKYHMYELYYRTRYFAKFSSNCYSRVYDGYSITYSLLQIAAYMGFKEIYLIGADCSYLGEKQHFIEHGVYESNPADITQKLFASYGTAKKYAEKNGISIVNVTRGGCLELFPRANLEDVINTDLYKSKA